MVVCCHVGAEHCRYRPLKCRNSRSPRRREGREGPRGGCAAGPAGQLLAPRRPPPHSARPSLADSPPPQTAAPDHPPSLAPQPHLGHEQGTAMALLLPGGCLHRPAGATWTGKVRPAPAASRKKAGCIGFVVERTRGLRPVGTLCGLGGQLNSGAAESQPDARAAMRLPGHRGSGADVHQPAGLRAASSAGPHPGKGWSPSVAIGHKESVQLAGRSLSPPLTVYLYE